MVGRVPLLLMLIGCTSTSQTTQPTNESACGVERWSIKNLLDKDTSQINWTPVQTTILAQDTVARISAGETTPRMDFEKQVVSIACTIVSFKKEDDGDIHLILQDSLGNQMIAEVPSVECSEVNASSHHASFKSASDWISVHLGKPTTSFKETHVVATVTGIRFQDFEHGQRGAAHSQREIHPILVIQ